MSPSDLSEMEQLDRLAAELAEAGHLARLAVATRMRPEPEYAMRLRAQLIGNLPSHRSAGAVALAEEPAAGAPIPPIRPLGDAVERRQGNRPFVGADRRAWMDESQSETLEIISAAAFDEMEPTRAAKRWKTPEDSTRPRRSSGLVAVPMLLDDGHDAEDAGRVTALKPAMRWHIPTRVMPSRWMAVGLAASIAAISLIYGSGVFTPGTTVATADEAVAATLVRGGASSALAAGTELREGDEIRTASTGRATLLLGSTHVRMAAGSDVKIKSLDADHLAISQITGRVYHRVAVPAGGDYRVETASVTWQVSGTAFDLDRYFTAGGGEQVRGMALYHDIDVSGPQLQESVAEGKSATIVLKPDGTPAGSPVIEAITEEALNNDWLITNAGLDARLGLPLGRLASLVATSPTAVYTDKPADNTDVPTSAATPPPPPPTPTPTVRPTVRPTARPTARPTPTGPANLGTLTITNNGDGTYTFSWPKYTGTGFEYYKVMHADYPKIPSYGTVGDYWACPSDVGETSWTGSIDPGDYNVRVQVVDTSSGKAVIRAQTNVVRLTVSPPPTQSLGALGAFDNGNGTWTFTWTAYSGWPFDYYKLVYEPESSGHDPSYPGGSPIWAAIATNRTSVTLTVGDGDFVPGAYRVRIQAIGRPYPYVYAQTTVKHITVS